MDIAELGIQVSSAPAVKGAADLDKLTVAAQRAEDQVQDLAASSARLGPSLGKAAGAAAGLSGNSRMLAQQLSQVGQMTMVTGNFAQALAVQLPDIGLAFGSIGAAAGLVAGIALPAVIAAMSGANAEAERLMETLEASGDAVAAYVKAAEAALQPNEKLAESYGILAGAAGRALQAMADVKQIEAINAVAASIQGLSDSLLEWEVARGGGRAGGAQQVLADDFGLAADEAQRLLQGVLALERAQGLQSQARAADVVAQQLLRAYGSVEAMPPALQKVYVSLSQVIVQAGGVQGAMQKSKTWTESLAATASTLKGHFDSAANAAWGLASAIGGALDKAIALAQQRVDAQNQLNQMAFEFSPGGQALMNYGSRAPGGTTQQNSLDVRNNPIAAGAGGGGGPTLADQFAERLTTLQEGLQTERDTLDIWYADAMTILTDRRSQEILGEQGHKDLMLQVEQEYQSKLADLQASTQQRRLGDMADFFGALQGIASAGGKGLVKAAATFGAIQGTINAYVAATEALRTPGLTIWGRFAAYASVLAAGLKGVAAIKAAGRGGGGGPAGSVGTPAAQGVTPAAGGSGPTSVIDVRGIDRNAIYTGAMWEMIFDGIFDEARRRGVSAPLLRFG